MSLPFERTYHDLQDWANAHGIGVGEKQLPPGKAGEFNGLSATMNPAYEVEQRVYYFVHALGSIVRWSLSRADIQTMFDELRAAKKEKQRDPARLERAIERYRAFESESSEFAVWLLPELRHADVVPSYTVFMRADLEALTQFHRMGKAPVWRTFWAQWNEEIARGRRQVVPFHPKPIPPFRPVQFEDQEILQEQG